MKTNSRSRFRLLACLLALLLAVMPLQVFADDATTEDLPLLISPAPSASLSAVDYYRAHKTLSDWWQVLALTAAGVDVEAEGFVLPELNAESVLSSGSSTVLAKAILSLGAIGQNPRLAFGDDASCDPVRALAALQQESGAFGSYLNEQIYAIIALECTDASAYDRESALAYLCSCRLADGGFAYFGDTGDVDLTAMTLLALQYFRGNEAAEAAISSAVQFLADNMSEAGTYPSLWEPGVEPSESISTAISGLVAVGVDMTAEPFSKLPAKLAEYQTTDGGYAHALGVDLSDAYATYQALLAVSELQSGVSAYASFAYDCSSADTIFTDAEWDDAQGAAFATMYNEGLIVGRPSRVAAADEALTVGELLVLLDRMTGETENGADGIWYAGALNRIGAKAGFDVEGLDVRAVVSASEFSTAVSGVLNATVTGEFADEAAVTRGEAVLFLASLLNR